MEQFLLHPLNARFKGRRLAGGGARRSLLSRIKRIKNRKRVNAPITSDTSRMNEEEEEEEEEEVVCFRKWCSSVGIKLHPHVSTYALH